MSVEAVASSNSSKGRYQLEPGLGVHDGTLHEGLFFSLLLESLKFLSSRPANHLSYHMSSKGVNHRFWQVDDVQDGSFFCFNP